MFHLEDRLYVGKSIGKNGVTFVDEAVHFVRNDFRDTGDQGPNILTGRCKCSKINSSYLHGIGHLFRV